jgi:predicted dehydrogenase
MPLFSPCHQAGLTSWGCKAMTLHRAVFYEPGHFHAALTLHAANPRLANDIHVYATPGPERQAFMALVQRFNQRAVSPTHWALHLHEGEQLLSRVVEESQGDFVVVAGRNDRKLETIAYLTQAGLHVLADKPWLTDSSQLPYLAQATAGPQLAMDIMTGQHSLLTRLITQVVQTPELFGTFVTDQEEPSLDMASVHHLYKRVNGQPLQRPAWYYDTTVQGDGLVDVQSHMVQQAQAWILGTQGGDIDRDIVLDTARRWTTPVPVDLFHDSTGLDAYPEALCSSVRDGVLQYACNGEMGYRLRGVGVRQSTEWRQREPAGGRDLHRLTIRGSRCHILVRQGEETAYQAALYLQPAPGLERDLQACLLALLAQWQDPFPGLAYEASAPGWRLLPPPGLDHGHESHFPLVLDAFLKHLDHGAWPEALQARLRMRYTLLARARDLALQPAVG